MQTQLNPAYLLQWYIDIGVDEVIGDMPIDRTKLAAPIPQKTAPENIIMMPAAPVMVQTAEQAPIGTIEALGEAKIIAAQCQTIEALKTALENFQGLSLKRTATQMVFADGVATAKVMLVGEVPNADEDRTGRPFVGAHGDLLDKMLAAIGLSRDENIYITNVVNWRTPGNRPPSESEIALSLVFLKRHIELVNPSVLIFMGGIATKALLETGLSVMKLRGRWMEYSSEGLAQPIPVMPMFSPAYLLNSPAQKGLAWSDLLNVKAKLAFKE